MIQRMDCLWHRTAPRNRTFSTAICISNRDRFTLLGDIDADVALVRVILIWINAGG